MNDYLLFLISIIAAACNNVILHFISFKNVKYNPFLFNAGISVVWLVVLSIIGGSGVYSATTVLYGVLYGLVMTGFLFFKTQAMATGPILLTSLLGCSSFVITTVFNAIYWKESVDFFSVAGIILMLAALCLTTMKGSSKNVDRESKVKANSAWGIYCVFFLLFAASTGIIFKFHQTYDRANTSEMMIVSAVVSALTFLVVYFVSKFYSKKKSTEPVGEISEKDVADKRKEKILLYCLLIACGIVSCVYNRLNVYLTGVLPSVLFFPVFNGSVVMLASVAGRFVFKEKLTKRQIAGVYLGLTAIVLISKFFGLF